MRNIFNYIMDHMNWSRKTFGLGQRTEGICRHIESELQEIREDPKDAAEWIDIIILAIDGAWRAGLSPGEIVQELWRKQKINFERDWPQVPEDTPSFHIK